MDGPMVKYALKVIRIDEEEGLIEKAMRLK
jgi:hypothetical protein